jgi:hypothetical protein
MASPFAYFRRNQRTLMALLTLAAMFTFVCVGFLGFGVEQLLQLMGVHRGRMRDPVVVRTNWTTLRASDLHGPGGLIYRRIVANRFVDAVQRKALQFATFPGFGDPSEEDVVMGEVLRHKAEQMGLTVDDAAVDKFLLAISGERLTAQGFVDIRNELNVSEELVYRVLRDELLAYNASILLGLRAADPLSASYAQMFTPEELREYYHKLRDRAEIEAAAVPAEAFLDQTEEPSEVQLREYFERYREFFSHPMSPMPGFRQHRRIEAEYVHADFDKTVEAVTVSDEEIEAYYEENKDSKYRLPDEPAASKDEESAAESDDAKGQKEGAAESGEENAAPAKQDGTDSTGKTPKLFPEPSLEPEAGAPSSPESREGAEKPGAGEPGAEPAEPAPGGASQSGPAAETDTAAPSASNQSEQSSEPVEPASSPGPTSEPAAQEPAGENTAPPQQDVAEKDQSKQAGAEKGETKTGDGAAPSEAAQTEGESKEEGAVGKAKSEARYRALDDALREEIRNQLKRSRARELIDELFGELQYEVFDRYTEQYAEWEAAREEAKQQQQADGKAASPQQPPAPPAPAPLELLGQRIEGTGSPSELLKRSVEVARASEKFGHVAAEYRTTGLVNLFEISELDGIAKARECTRGEPVTGNSAPFANVAFHSTNLYVASEVCATAEPEEKEADTFNPEPPEKTDSYLFWKSQDRPEFTPQQLSEVRDQVVGACRLDQARALARKRAGELAQAARGKGNSLAESLAEEKINPGAEAVLTVVHPPTFTWLSRPQGRSFAAPGITDVEGIEHAGEEFMRTVFDLAEGEVGVAPDAPEKTYYVVRAEVMQPAPRSDLLREDFFGFMSEYQQVAQQLDRTEQTDLARRLIQEAGVKWEGREEG